MEDTCAEKILNFPIKKTHRKCENFGANFNFKSIDSTFTRWKC